LSEENEGEMTESRELIKIDINPSIFIRLQPKKEATVLQAAEVQW
jgi:hypothetical protein